MSYTTVDKSETVVVNSTSEVSKLLTLVVNKFNELSILLISLKLDNIL